MGALTKALLLFALNWLDAQLTILWVRMNVATEGNALMAALLDHSETSFLSVKLAIGALAGYTLYRFAEIPDRPTRHETRPGALSRVDAGPCGHRLFSLRLGNARYISSAIIAGLPNTFLALLLVNPVFNSTSRITTSEAPDCIQAS